MDTTEEEVKLAEAKDVENDKQTDYYHERMLNDKKGDEQKDAETKDIANGHCGNGELAPSTERRSDEPSELSFEKGLLFLFDMRM